MSLQKVGIQAFLLFALVLAIGSSAAPCAYAQDDPFALPGGAGSDPQTTPIAPPSASQQPIDQGLSNATRLIIQSVIDANPSTREDLAKAVETMVDIGQFERAKSYLKQLIDSAGSDQELFDLYRTVGGDFFLRLSLNPELQPEAASYARNVMATANRMAQRPERVEQLIQLLNDPNITIRSDAFRKLRRIGATATASMLNVFTDPERENEYPGIRSALARMSGDALLPLQGGLRANHLLIQAESIRALANYSSTEAADGLFRVLFSERIPEPIRKFAKVGLDRVYPEEPTQKQAEARLLQRIKRYLGDRETVDSSAIEDVTIWRWDSQTSKLAPKVLPRDIAERVMASDFAADLYQINPNQRHRDIYRLTHLEAAKWLVGNLQTVDVPTLVSALQLTPENVEKLLDYALEQDFVPTAIACCEVLEAIGDSRQLVTRSGSPSPLVEAILQGNRHLQFAAFRAIQKLDPDTAFPGSSYVMGLAVYMAQSRGQSAGLVIHRGIGLAQSHAALLASAGLNGIATNDSADLLRLAMSNPDLVAIFISDSVLAPNYIELANQLRQDWRTRNIPIGVLSWTGDADRRLVRHLRSDRRTMVFPMSSTPSSVKAHVAQMASLADPWPIGEAERQIHAATAMDWLARVAADRKKYDFFDFSSHQEAIAKLLYSSVFNTQACEILAGLGTPFSQRQLIDFASQSGLPPEKRRTAANAFRQSVTRSGPLLTTDQIKLQYKRYNASEFDSQESQEILGSLLDAIEMRRRQQLKVVTPTMPGDTQN